MDNTDTFVKGRLAEGVAPDAIVQELKEHPEQVDAVLIAYVNGFTQHAEPESHQHHSFRLTRIEPNAVEHVIGALQARTQEPS